MYVFKLTSYLLTKLLKVIVGLFAYALALPTIVAIIYNTTNVLSSDTACMLAFIAIILNFIAGIFFTRCHDTIKYAKEHECSIDMAWTMVGNQYECDEY